MEENETEDVTLNEDDTEDTEITPEADQTATEDVDKLKKEIATLTAQKDHWRDKAEKKGEEKVEMPNVVEQKNDELSSKDLYALMEARVPKEDVDDVVKASKVLGKSVTESLDDEVVKALLNKKMEERTTADATNTVATRRVKTKEDGSALLADAKKGRVDDSDAGIDALVKAKFEEKHGKKK